jgi:hypothetical protein
MHQVVSNCVVFSSQYVIPISRYIVVAVVRCSCACSRLPERRGRDSDASLGQGAGYVKAADHRYRSARASADIDVSERANLSPAFGRPGYSFPERK